MDKVLDMGSRTGSRCCYVERWELRVLCGLDFVADVLYGSRDGVFQYSNVISLNTKTADGVVGVLNGYRVSWSRTSEQVAPWRNGYVGWVAMFAGFCYQRDSKRCGVSGGLERYI